MDYSKIVDEIADTMKHGGAPLFAEQRELLAGSISVHLEKAYEEGRSHQAKLEIQARDRFLANLRAKESR